jgi:toxin ParE1/3/4
MSARRLPVNFSPEAWDDLEDIALYSELTWGEEQKDHYLAALDRALLRLGDFPQLGRVRDDLRPGYRSLHIEQHVAIYEVLPTEVYVLRILHGRMDAQRALQGEP